MQNDKKPSKLSMLKYGIVPAGAFAVVPAHAAIDVTEAVNQIKEASTAVDAIGLALIGVAAGMLIIGLIIGMIMRRS